VQIEILSFNLHNYIGTVNFNAIDTPVKGGKYS
jgi:hypothetical protein